jgi:hypothetical protein
MFGLPSGLIEVTKQTGVGYNGLESFQDIFTRSQLIKDSM